MQIHDKNPKIDLPYYKPVQDRSPEGEASAAKGKGTGSGSDVVALSPTARELQKAGKVLQDLPEVRLEKVNRIREQIESGTYRIDRARIADRMLRESLLNDADK